MLSKLPVELVETGILSYLDPKGLSRCMGVDKTMKETSSSCQLWREIVLKKYGVSNDLALPRDSHEQKLIPWREVYLSAEQDKRFCSDDPLLWLTTLQQNVETFGRAQDRIRLEIACQQALCSFPSSVVLFRVYSELIQKYHVSVG